MCSTGVIGTRPAAVNHKDPTQSLDRWALVGPATQSPPLCHEKVCLNDLSPGQKLLTLQGALPRQAGFKQNLCADIDGFSLHAAVRSDADDRKALEQLYRYISRPALANERV